MDFYSLLCSLKNFLKGQEAVSSSRLMKEILSFVPEEDYVAQHPSVLKLLSEDLREFAVELKKNQTKIEAEHIYVPLIIYLKIYLTLITFQASDIIKAIGAFPEHGVLAFLEGIPLFFQGSPSKHGSLMDQLLKETREVISHLSKALRLNKLALLSSEAQLIFESIIDMVYLSKSLPGTLQNTHLKTLSLIGVECWIRIEGEKQEANSHLLKVIRERSIDKSKTLLELDNGDRIHFLSYVILQYYQQSPFLNRVSLNLDQGDAKAETDYRAIEEVFKRSVKQIKAFVISLLKLCDEDYKKASRIFTAAFLKDCVTCCGDAEIQVASVFINLFTLVLAQRFSDKKKAPQNAYNFLIEDILQVLLVNIKNKFIQSTKHLSQLKDAFLEHKPSRGFSAKCKKCGFYVRAEAAFCSDLTAEAGVCVICFIQAVSDKQSEEMTEKQQSKRFFESAGPLSTRVEPLVYRWCKKNDPFFILTALEELNVRFLTFGDDYHSSRQYYLSKLTQNTRSEAKPARNAKKDKRLQTLIETYWNGIEPKTNLRKYQLNEEIRRELISLAFFVIDLELNYDSLYKLLFFLSDNNAPLMRAKILQIFLSMFSAEEAVSPSLDIGDIIEIRRNDKSEVVRTKVVEMLMKIIGSSWDLANKYCVNLIESLNDVSPAIRRRILEFLLEVTRNDDLQKQKKFAEEDDETSESPAPFSANQLCVIVERVYNDLEENSEIAIEILARILFSSFKKEDQRSKKRIKATSVSKSAAKTPANKKFQTNWLRLRIESRVDLFCSLFMAIKEDIKQKHKRKRVGKLINEWFEAVIECDQRTRGEDKSEVKMLVSTLLDRVLRNQAKESRNQEREQVLVVLEILQNFSKFYPEIFFDELTVLARCFEVSCSMRKKLLRGPEEAISDVRDCILLLSEILQATLKVKDFVTTKALVDRWNGIEENLEELIYSEPLLVLHEGAKLLSLSCRSITQNYLKITAIQKNLENYIESMRLAFTKSSPMEFLSERVQERENLKRCLYLQAIFTKYFSYELDTESSLQTLEEYIDDLKFFIRIQHPELEPTCVECLTMLWEIQPFLVFETKNIIDRYLRPPSSRNDVNVSIVRQIFVIFFNLLQKNELNVKAILKERKNLVNEERDKFMKNQKDSESKPSAAKKFLQRKQEEMEQVKEIQQSTSSKVPENPAQNLNNISQMIREFTRPAFSHHILRKEKQIRLAVLNVLNALVAQGLMSSFEICGHLTALICDSESEIRKKAMVLLKSEWSVYPQNIFLNLEKGFRFAFTFVKSLYGSPRAHFYDAETGVSRGFFEDLNEEMSSAKLKAKGVFPVLCEKLMDTIDKITILDESHLEFLLFLGETLLTLGRWQKRDLLLIAKGLFENATTLVHKVLKALKDFLSGAAINLAENDSLTKSRSLGEPIEEHSIGHIFLGDGARNEMGEKKLSEDKEQAGSSPNTLLLLQSFGVANFLCLGQLLLSNAGKEILGKDSIQSGQYTLMEYIETVEKKLLKEESLDDAAEGSEGKAACKAVVFNATLIEKYRDFANDIFKTENYANDIQAVYHLYKKIKRLYYGEVYDNINIILGFGKSLEQELDQEPTHETGRKKKPKAKGQKAQMRIPKARKQKKGDVSSSESDEDERGGARKRAFTAVKKREKARNQRFLPSRDDEASKKEEEERLEEARLAATEYKSRLRRKNNAKYPVGEND